MSEQLDVYIGIASANPSAMGRCAAVVRAYQGSGVGDLEPVVENFAQVNSFALRTLVAVLTAVQPAVEADPVPVCISTNNEYIYNGITKWMKAWIANGWITKASKPVSQRKEWEDARRLLTQCNAMLFYVSPHSPSDEEEARMAEVARDAVKLVPATTSAMPQAGQPPVVSVSADLKTMKIVDYPPAEPLPLLEGQGAW